MRITNKNATWTAHWFITIYHKISCCLLATGSHVHCQKGLSDNWRLGSVDTPTYKLFHSTGHLTWFCSLPSSFSFVWPFIAWRIKAETETKAWRRSVNSLEMSWIDTAVQLGILGAVGRFDTKISYTWVTRRSYELWGGRPKSSHFWDPKRISRRY